MSAPLVDPPDAMLIGQCDEFAALSLRIAHIYNVEFASDDDGADRTAEPLHQRREELLDLICGAQATTIEGLRARGRMMVAYQDGADRFPHGPWPESMISALLHDLTAREAEGGAGPPDDRGGYIGLRRTDVVT